LVADQGLESRGETAVVEFVPTQLAVEVDPVLIDALYRRQPKRGALVAGVLALGMVDAEPGAAERPERGVQPTWRRGSRGRCIVELMPAGGRREADAGRVMPG
jgi:hypothetical protein